MPKKENDLSQLEELDVIEARELSVGNAFHAFRFSAIEAVDQETQLLLDKAAKALGIKTAEFSKLVTSEAVESNAHANFARGVLAALQTRSGKKG